ncbi:hypothetical protein M513_09877 [Trichuris suis]|nr:hypothetical protein M513_09877 [Trichuris suis]
MLFRVRLFAIYRIIGMLCRRDGKDEAHLGFGERKKAKASTSTNERKPWLRNEIGFFRMKAVLLAVSLILSLPGYSIAAPGTPMELSLPTKHVLMIKVNELRAARNALSMDCIFYRFEAYEMGCAVSKCEQITPQAPPTGQLVRGPFLWVCAFTSRWFTFLWKFRAPPEMPPYLQLPAGTQNCLMCSYQKSKCDEVTKNLCCDDAWDKLIVPPQDSQGNPTGPSGSSGTSSGMFSARDGKAQEHLTLREGKKAKASTSADERKRWQCTEIGFFSTSAVLLAVFVILSLPEYSTAQAGTPLPLSNDDKTAIMTKINELRADKNALMMDCIRFWNNSMAAYAQTVANKCSSVAPVNETYPLAISVAQNETIEDAFGSIDEIGNWYNPRSKNCDADGETVFSTEQCQNFRQFYRYEAHEVGCAKSRCEKITPDKEGEAQVVEGPILWVCAFTSKAPPQLLPYIDLPVSVSNCEICSYQKSICGALTNNLCCDDQWDTFVIPSESEPQPSDPNKDVSPPEYFILLRFPGDDGSKNSTVPPGDDGPKNSTAPPGNDGPKNATVPPGDDGSKNSTLPPGGQPESSNSSKDNVPVENVRVNIVLYKDNALGRTIMAFEGLDNTFPANSALEPTRYTRTGPIGSIVKNGSSIPGCKELKPIHQLYSAVTGETAYVANQKHIDNLVNELGFKDKGIIGQTVSGLKECNATKLMAGLCLGCKRTVWSSAVMPSIFYKTFLLNVMFTVFYARITNAQTGTPLPTSTSVATALLSSLNTLRSTKRGFYMECIRHWNADMATYAQAVANNCSTTAPPNPTFPVAISAAADENPTTAFNSIEEIGLLYNANSFSCDQYSEAQCQNYRQLFRFDLNQTGCAKARCDTISPSNGPPDGQNAVGPILWVCAFDASAPTGKAPYIQMPPDIPDCALCSSSKPICDSTTNNLCCDASVYDLVVQSGGAAGCGTEPRPEDRINVSRYYDNSIRSNILAFTGNAATIPADLNTNTRKYTILGPVGSVVKPGAAVPGCPYLKPIRHLYSTAAKQNLYLIDEVEIVARLEEGMQDRGIVGQAVTGHMMCNATIAMYRFRNPAISVVQLSNLTDANLRLWNRDIAIYAQTVADDCSGQRPNSPKYPMAMALLPADIPITINAMIQGFQLIPDSYNIELDSCDQGVNRPVSQDTCRSIRQVLNYSNEYIYSLFFKQADWVLLCCLKFYWFQGNETGCGFTRCTAITNADPALNINNGYVLACGFSIRAAEQFRPYPPPNPPNSVPCLTCLSGKDLCDATTLNLCCDGVIGNLRIVDSEGAKRLACGQQPENLTNAFRFYDNFLRTNILSFDSIPTSFPADLKSQEKRYTILGPVGSIVPLGYANAEECPFLEPIVHLYSNVLRQNLYLINKLEIEIRIQEGHIDRGVVGYAVSGYAMCNATIAMYRFYNRFINGVQLSNYTDVRLVFTGTPPDYESEGISFYLWQPVSSAESIK